MLIVDIGAVADTRLAGKNGLFFGGMKLILTSLNQTHCLRNLRGHEPKY